MRTRESGTHFVLSYFTIRQTVTGRKLEEGNLGSTDWISDIAGYVKSTRY